MLDFNSQGLGREDMILLLLNFDLYEVHFRSQGRSGQKKQSPNHS